MFDYLILGGGITGIACVRHLTRVDPSARILVADTRESFPLLKENLKFNGDIRVKANFRDEHLLRSARQVIVSPGVNRESFINLVEDSVLLYGELELFKKYVDAPVIGITGSNGKSTVTTLMGNVIKDAGYKVAVGGNLGIPALELLLEKPDYYVLELSSFQLETVQDFPLAIATFLNLSPDHEDRYYNLNDYLRAKQRIFQKADKAVVYLDGNVYNDISLPMISFGLSADADYWVKNNSILYHNNVLLKEEDLKIKGKHNLLNIAAVLAMSEILNLSLDKVLDSIYNFSGLLHRCQWVREKNGVIWYNDSKGTNVGATLAALQGLGDEKNVILILGGIGKNADFSYLNEALEQYVKTLILFGRDKELIKGQISYSGRILVADNLADVVALADKSSITGDKVIFSPACASMDMFKNFEDRGEQFMQLVLAL